MRVRVPVTPVVTKVYFKPGELSFDRVFELAKEWYIVKTWNHQELVYAIVLELKGNGKVNTTIQ